jgi:predicted ABC-type exoprotein transport system, permease component
VHPTSEPAHESVPQTSPGVAKRTYDERAAFEEAKRNLGIVGDKEQQFDRGMAILGKAYSIAMMLILVYFLLDAYQILVTAGRSLNIGSFIGYAVPKILPDAVFVVPFLWIVLDWVKDGYINPRRLIMLYLLLCSLSGVLAFAGVFGLAQVLFPAFTALDPVSHPAAASSMVSQALVAVITAGSAVLLFLLTRPAVGAVPSFAVIRKQMRAIEESTSGAEDEEELTREDVLRQLEKEEGPVKDSTEQLLRELSADYALSNDPAEKNRLLDEIQQVQRAQKAGVKPNFGGASAGESGKPHEQAHGARRLLLALPRLPRLRWCSRRARRRYAASCGSLQRLLFCPQSNVSMYLSITRCQIALWKICRASSFQAYSLPSSSLSYPFLSSADCGRAVEGRTSSPSSVALLQFLLGR